MEAGFDDGRLEIVRDYHYRHAAKDAEGPHMAADPIRQALRPGRLDISVVRSPKGGDEDLRRPHLSGLRADHIHCLACIVDKQPFTCRVALPHHRGKLALPARVQAAILAIAVAARMNLPVLKLQGRQRHPFAAQYGMDIGPIQQRGLV